MQRQNVLIFITLQKKRLMTIQRNPQNERLTFEEYFALLEKDPKHGYEYLDGRVYGYLFHGRDE